LPGLAWPQWFAFGVSGWNKGVRLAAGALRSYVLKVCYYVLFGAVSWTGSSLDLALGTGTVSRWIPKGRHDSRSDDPERSAAGNEARSHGLLAALRNPGQGQAAWTVFL